MDKRFFLALTLSAIVLVGTQLLFSSPTPPPARPPATATPNTVEAPPTGASTAPPLTPPTVARGVDSISTPTPSIRPETTVVEVGRSTYQFASPGAAPLSVTLADFPNLRERGAPVTLAAERSPLLDFRLLLGTDTVPLRLLPGQMTRSEAAGTPVLTYTATHGATRITVTNSFVPDSYVVRVRGLVENAPPNSALLVELPRGLRSHEADAGEDLRSLAFSYKPQRDDPQGIKFSDLDSGLTRIDPGPMKWVALRNKYFLTVAVAEGATPLFHEFRTTPGLEINGVVREASGVAVLPLNGGRFELSFLAGPQKARLLQSLGNDLINVNPYGGWLHGMVQPFASIVNNILLWLKDTTKLNYGWVLIIFGIMVRLLLWPLNQSAMRSSIKMQRLQPELQEIQKKYSQDPERQREAIMKVYASHGMSPFSPMLGCLPMLLPMPVLFALYFVFQNTIEFRGVQFWWLPDISLKDPYYIVPIFMGLSMLLLSWIGMRGMPPNPQAKVMGYMMPPMMTLLFLNFPSGLNLYYAVQNVAAMPQQWLLTRERQKAGVAAPAPKPPKSDGGGPQRGVIPPPKRVR
jgi:YidC/Oxa1 family membrane protein insertase